MNGFNGSHLGSNLVGGLIAFVVSLAASYFLWRKTRLDNRFWSLTPEVLSAVPYVGGVAAGLLAALALGGSGFAAGDRFYSSAQARIIAFAFIGALALLQLAALPGGGSGRKPFLIWVGRRVLELTASGLVVWAGVRFSILGWGAETQLELGQWAIPLTIAWLLAAMYITRLLDGLDGAASVLLLTAAVAVVIGARGSNEYLLTAICVAVIGAVVGALRFHFFPARLPVRGSSTHLFGFTFAVLTVMARQKTVAAVLLIFPLVVVLLLLGGAMLGLLERTLLLPDRSGKETDAEETPDE